MYTNVYKVIFIYTYIYLYTPTYRYMYINIFLPLFKQTNLFEIQELYRRHLDHSGMWQKKIRDLAGYLENDRDLDVFGFRIRISIAISI